MGDRPLNDFVYCSCGVTYISGYTHCPHCNKRNEHIKQDKTEIEKHLAETFDNIIHNVNKH